MASPKEMMVVRWGINGNATTAWLAMLHLLVGFMTIAGTYSCSSTVGAKDVASVGRCEFVDRFDGCLGFLPPNMRGVWLSDRRALEMRPDFYQPADHIELRCGRAFQLPLSFGVGGYDGVTIEDYLLNPVPAARIEGWTEDGDQISGLHVYHMLNRNDGNVWRAIVDHRFVVSATSRELLSVALKRGRASNQSLRAHCRRLCQGLTADVTDLVVRFDQTPSAVIYDTAPDVAAILMAKPWHIVYCMKRCEHGSGLDVTMYHWRRVEGKCARGIANTEEYCVDEETVEAWMQAELLLMTTYGLNVIL